MHNPLRAEIGLGVGLLWRGAQGTIPHKAEISHRDDSVYRVLVLANQTVGGRALLAELQNRSKGRSSEILVVVPARTSTGHRTSIRRSTTRGSASTHRSRRWPPPDSRRGATWATITSPMRRSRMRCATFPPTRS